MPQIINITSEALQATIRRLLPSQQGFGLDLQATNVVTPIIDLTPTAEGSALDSDLARSMAFGSQTAFDVTNTSETLANSPGFWRIFGAVTVEASGSNDAGAFFLLTDSLASKVIWGLKSEQQTAQYSFSSQFDFNVFLAAGESLSVNTNSPNSHIVGSYRQIADVNGQTTNPSGFVQQ